MLINLKIFQNPYILLFLVSLIPSELCGQTDSVLDFSRNRGNRFYFGLNGNLTISAPLKIKYEQGPQRVQNSTAVGSDFGIRFGWVRDDKHYLTTGFKFFQLNNGIKYTSRTYNNLEPDFLLAPLLTVGLMNFLSVPLTYEYSFLRRNNKSVNFVSGISLDFFKNYSSQVISTLEDSIGNKQTIFYGYLNSIKRSNISAHAGLAYYISIFKLQDFRIALEYNHSFNEMMSGRYIIDPESPEYSIGSWSMSGSYISIGASYLFTGINKEKRVHIDDYDPLKFPKIEFGAGFYSNWHGEPVVTKFSGQQQLITKPSVSFEGGLYSQCRLSNRFSMFSGVSFGAIPATYGYEYPIGLTPSLTEPVHAEYRMGGINYWKVPLIAEVNPFKIRQLQKLAFTTGIGFQYINSMFYSDYEYYIDKSVGDTMSLFTIDLESNLNSRINLNYTIGMAYYINLFRSADLRINLNYNLSPSKVVSGEYTLLRNTPYQTTGSYSKNNNHLSFGVNYFFRKAAIVHFKTKTTD